MKRKNGVILSLAIMLVYSMFYDKVEDVNVLSGLCAFLPYIGLAIGLYYDSRFYNREIKSSKILTIIFAVILCAVMICAYFCASEVDINIRKYALLLEFILVILSLVICYRLDNITETSEMSVFDTDKLVSDLENNNGESSSKAKGIALIYVYALLFGIECFILPLIMKIIKPNISVVIISYLLFSVLFVGVTWVKNAMYFGSIKKTLINTCTETVLIVLGCTLDAYYNVYDALIVATTHSVILIPYLLMGLGIIPFLYNSNIMLKKYGKTKSNC